ncbi:MAG: hypothetical protein M1830_004841 [Pleopsidium flavum]|nr:MAG: hypothetical protein M1830_004841 [Pleopsidium flavum]
MAACRRSSVYYQASNRQTYHVRPGYVPSLSFGTADAVDPLYPVLLTLILEGQNPSQTFYADYEHFWTLEPQEQGSVDGALVALTSVMLAMGTQMVTIPLREEKVHSADFYMYASHQASRVSSYLSGPSTRSIQATVLITYFLMNENHASDGWAFSGLLIRQAYTIGLNRDPSIIVPHATPFGKQQRLKLWQAVLHLGESTADPIYLERERTS